MTFSISHWGEFPSPTRVVNPELIVVGPRVQYSYPLQYWNGERWVTAERPNA